MSSRFLLLPAAGTLLLFGVGCTEEEGPLDPIASTAEAAVFSDAFAAGVEFQAFGGSKTDAVSIVSSGAQSGTSALRVEVPGPGDPSGSYAGGALVAASARDLRGFDALTFWARASTSATLNTVGFGNDNTGTSRFQAEVVNLPLSTEWTKYVIPIPRPLALGTEAGLFFFAEGPEGASGYEIFFDDIRFETLGSLTRPRPRIPTQTVSGTLGSTSQISGTSVTYAVDGADVTVLASPSYFFFNSANQSVATVDGDGMITIVGDGTTTIAATLRATAAQGLITVSAAELPATAAPAPTYDAANVISLFSDAYTDVSVDTWSAPWDVADVTELAVDNDATKVYTNLVFAGIEFTSQTIDASEMTSFRMDVWTADPTASPAAFRVKLVDFGADGAFDGGDDSEHELTFTAGTSPPLQSRSWVTLDLPLSSFANLSSTEHLAQLIISGDPNTVYVDNVLFHSEGSAPPPPPVAPTEAAPTPTVPEADVISMFSNAYTDVAVDTWSAVWDQADVTDVQVAGDDVKLYENLVFAGIEATTSPIDATGMTHVHFDIWTPDPTASPAEFRFKLVDFGPNGVYGDGSGNAPGDDTEHEITLNAASSPPLATGSWVSYDVPLSDFTNLTTQAAIAQVIISGDPNTVYFDNLYFHRGTPAPTAPTEAAPTPTVPEASVISLFSNAYTDEAVDTWSAVWDQADVTDVQVAGDDVKLYENLVFAGIEATTSPIDATGMTHVHFDIWTPDPTASPAEFRFKLVDFGPNGVYGDGSGNAPGDDTEHEITLNAASSPPLATGSWVSYDVPLSDFTNLTTQAAIAQVIISGDPNTVYFDNLYFHR